MEEETKVSSKKNKLFTVILAFLFLVSIVQAIQLIGMASTLGQQEEKLSSLEAMADKISSSDVSSLESGQGSSSLPSSLQNLPDMVGGC